MLQRGRGRGAGRAATARKGSELDLIVGNEAVGAVSGEPRERNAVAWDPWQEPEAGVGSRGCSAVDGRGHGHVNGRGQASEADGREGGISGTAIPPPPRGRGGRGFGDIDYIWTHGKSLAGNSWFCNYCKWTGKGGGATRFKEHLSGASGNVHACMSAPSNVVDTMRDVRIQLKEKKRKKNEADIRVENELLAHSRRKKTINIEDDDDANLRLGLLASRMEFEKRNRAGCCSGGGVTSGAGGSCGIKRYFDADLAKGQGDTQQTMEACINKAEYAEDLGRAWSKWFHANDIPGHKANCPYFKAALKLTLSLPKGVPLPRGLDIDGKYLQSNYEELQAYMAAFKNDWGQYGVTVMCDSWTGPSRMSIINFMVFCNGRMHFHKSVNATGCVQNYQYVLEQIRKVVVNEIGEKFVVQIVTDNGSNFKKACKELCKEYPHITWQPCAAHTINLMLKEIGSFPEVDAVVTSAKRICRFFYNHSTLHAEMHDQIDGELVRPNATRFGTAFMFLQSFWDKQDRFKQWMTSDEWKNSTYCKEPDYDYAYDCLTSRGWWEDVEWVLNVVRPIYKVLRYADSQVAGSLAGFMPRIMQARNELSSLFEEGSADQKKYLDVVDKRVTHLCDDTLMVAAGLLDPQGHYKFKLASDRIRQRAFTKAIMKIADEEDAIEAIEQFGQYSSFRGNFDTQMARDGASRLSPTQWWLSFGGDVGTLQKYALRIVSQCTSSSGCERNWSTFALIHTQVRNRLGYEKLHKLVYVHYNLQLRVQQIEGEMKERELDPCGMMLNATLYDNANPIMDWLTNSRSESEPLLDADDYDEEAAAAYEHDYNNRLPTPTHDLVDPVLIEEPLMRPINKRKTRTVNAPIIEEEDEDEVEEETDDDMEDNGENEELPLDDNAAPRRVSTRRRTKSRKLLDTDITSRTSRKEG